MKLTQVSYPNQFKSFETGLAFVRNQDVAPPDALSETIKPRPSLSICASLPTIAKHSFCTLRPWLGLSVCFVIKHFCLQDVKTSKRRWHHGNANSSANWIQVELVSSHSTDLRKLRWKGKLWTWRPHAFCTPIHKTVVHCQFIGKQLVVVSWILIQAQSVQGAPHALAKSNYGEGGGLLKKQPC